VDKFVWADNFYKIKVEPKTGFFYFKTKKKYLKTLNSANVL